MKSGTGVPPVNHAQDVQRMTAGTGVAHSESNPLQNEPVHLLQIWILPQEPGLEPSYEQKFFSGEVEIKGRQASEMLLFYLV